MVLEAIADVRSFVNNEDNEEADDWGVSDVRLCYPTLRMKHLSKIDQKKFTVDLMQTENKHTIDKVTYQRLCDKLFTSIHIAEECYMKEKLCYKRALTLCWSLLKNCSQSTESDQCLIDVCQQLIQKCSQ